MPAELNGYSRLAKPAPLLTVFAFTLVVTLAGAILAPPNDVWPNLLIAGVFLSGLGLSGGFVVAIHDASRGN